MVYTDNSVVEIFQRQVKKYGEEEANSRIFATSSGRNARWLTASAGMNFR